VDNKEISDTIKNLQAEIYLTIGYIKEAMTSYDRTNNTQFVQDSVNIFVNQLTPKLNQIMNLKYNYNIVDVENGVYKLVQKKTNIEQLELTYKDSVVNTFEYKTIAYKQKSSKSKTLKVREGVLSKNKTIKNKPGLIIEESDNEEAEVQEYASNEPQKFIIDENNIVTWRSPDYQTLWDRMSQQMRATLADDPTWMEASMDKYVESRKVGKPMVFVEPPNLIIPPNALPDGVYDFGNELYNEFYNDPENSVYKTFGPSMLRDAMNNVVAKQLDFRKYV
jgi:hypothetical protein